MDDEGDVVIVVLRSAIGYNAGAGWDVLIVGPHVGCKLNGSVSFLKHDPGEGREVITIRAAVDADVFVDVVVGDLGEVFAVHAVHGWNEGWDDGRRDYGWLFYWFFGDGGGGVDRGLQLGS